MGSRRCRWATESRSSGPNRQVGTPEDIWLRPAGVKVARLFGDPPVNILRGELRSEGGKVFFVRPEMKIELSESQSRAAVGLDTDEVFIGLRAKSLRLASDMPGAPAQVYSNEAFGKHAILTLRLKGGDLVKIKTSQSADYVLGDWVAVDCAVDDCLLFHGRTGALL